MALLKCEECGNQVSDKADKCPNCGIKQKKPLSLLAFLGIILIFFVFIGSCLDKSEVKTTVESNIEKRADENTGRIEYDNAKNAVVEKFKTEPTAKDSVWTSDKVFKVGVIDDNTNRDGYANYVCEVLYDYGFKGKDITVKIIDVVKLVKNNKWENIGSAQCK